MNILIYIYIYTTLKGVALHSVTEVYVDVNKIVDIRHLNKDIHIEE